MGRVTEEEIIELLEDINGNIDYRTEKALIDGSCLTSLDVLSIISAIDEEFDVSIPAKDIVPENFNSATALCELVESLR